MQKELIYEKMNGFLAEDTVSIPKEITIEDEFADGKECSRLYERAYLAKQNLCRRLGKDEDNDIEMLINSMENIARLLSMKMYEASKAFSKDSGMSKKDWKLYDVLENEWTKHWNSLPGMGMLMGIL